MDSIINDNTLIKKRNCGVADETVIFRNNTAAAAVDVAPQRLVHLTSVYCQQEHRGVKHS